MTVLVQLSIFLLLWAQAPVSAGGVLEGIVVRAGTTMPLEGARVVIRSVTRDNGALEPVEPVLTDRQGRFRVEGVQPGRYLAMALKSGYVPQFFGSRQTGVIGLAGTANSENEMAALGTPIRVREGALTSGIEIPLTPAASLSGRVLGSNGEPLVGMQVELFPLAFDASGRRTYFALFQADTNDRGEYRFFNVEPGRYYVRVSWTRFVMSRQEIDGEARSVDADNSNGKRFAPAYFPGVAEVMRAAPVTVRSGDAMTGVDVVMGRLAQRDLRRVRVRVVDGLTGGPLSLKSSPTFILVPRFMESPQSIVALQPGRVSAEDFELKDVAEGEYWMTVRLAASSDPEVGSGRLAVVPLDVSGRDPASVTVRVDPPLMIDGRVLLDGNPWIESTNSAFQMRLVSTPFREFPANVFADPPPSLWRDEGDFSFDGVLPGKYDLLFSGLPAGVFVKQARYGRADALSESLSVSGAETVFEVELSSRSGSLQGAVVDAGGQVVPYVEVVLVPEDLTARPERYRNVKTDLDGRFSVTGIAPGKYRAFALINIPRFDYFDRDFLNLYGDLGKTVLIEEGAAANTTLNLAALR